MGAAELSFVLVLIIEGCAGPRPSGVCSVQNFSIRLPYDRVEQCEAAQKRMVLPADAQKYIKAFCMAVPKQPPLAPAPGF